MLASCYINNLATHIRIMENSKSYSNKLYYACQFIGHFIFLSFTSLMALENKVDGKSLIEILQGPVIVACSALLTSHFLLRWYLKKNTKQKLLAFKHYALGLIVSAMAMSVLIKLIETLWGVPPAEEGILKELLVGFIVGTFLLTIWNLLYFSITSIRDKKRMASELKEQQIACLMNQINPHFLFNSLNTIRGMIFEDKDKSAELVTQLSTLFRYNLSTDTKAQTTLEEELTVCQHYLAIEDIRLGARLKVTFNISPESKSAKIPTMGLLTLVENSIKHGISHLQQGGELIICSAIEQEQLTLTVTNPFDQSLVKSGTQVGLKNLQQRIDLIFSEQGSISSTKVKDQFIATLTLPHLAF